MLSINTNLSSLIAQNSMSSATKLLNQAVERMTTGYKINHSKDNAANYSIANSMSAKLSSYQVAQDNCAMGLDMLATANGSLDQISDKLTRLRDLQTQASNGTYGATSLNAINAEANALVDEINRLYQTAEYNGMKLFGKSIASTTAFTEVTPTTFSLARTAETITSVGFIETIEKQDTSSAISISSIEEGGTLYTGQTYSISTPEDLVKLNSLSVDETNYGDLKLVLNNNIDMSSINNWEGISLSPSVYSIYFEGNGYIISNLHGTAGLFGYGINCPIIKNLGLENVDITGSGAFIDTAWGGYLLIQNCYATGTVASGGSIVGSIWACDSYILSVVSDIAGGDSMIGGLVGIFDEDDSNITDISIKNSQCLGKSDNLEGVFIGKCVGDTNVELQDCVYNNYYDTLGIPLIKGSSTSSVTNTNPVEVSISSNSYGTGGANGGAGGGTSTGPSYAPDTVLLQVGTSSGWASQIGVGIKFTLDNPDELRMIGLDLTTDYLTKIDEMLAMVSEKQTEYGAAQNRLESALESIAVNIENLTSSRSTIRDADIAKVSSEYIRQQILQQASATLLSTANQSPSIALQLI